MYRRRGSTGVNANSSRSHAVLQIELRDKREADKLARFVLRARHYTILLFKKLRSLQRLLRTTSAISAGLKQQISQQMILLVQ